MSKHYNTPTPLGELFIDATREVLEKGRIKAQMMRLERIMESDRARKKSIYAEIGQMYVEGSIAHARRAFTQKSARCMWKAALQKTKADSATALKPSSTSTCVWSVQKKDMNC